MRTSADTTAPLRPMPRHGVASKSSTAQRTGTSVDCCSHAGKMNVGTLMGAGAEKPASVKRGRLRICLTG
jgi:hypothetical protein